MSLILKARCYTTIALFFMAIRVRIMGVAVAQREGVHPFPTMNFPDTLAFLIDEQKKR